MPKKSPDLEIFRIKVGLILEQHSTKMKVFLIENKLAGMTDTGLTLQMKDPLSKWSLEWDSLNRKIKSEVGGFINRLHIRAYTGEVK